MGHGNLIGPQVRRLRYQRGWTQKILAAKLQIAGLDVTRGDVAKIEARLMSLADYKLLYFMRVFDVPMTDLFPSIDVQQPELYVVIEDPLHRRY